MTYTGADATRRIFASSLAHCLPLLIALLLTPAAAGQGIKAFPQAEGSGAGASGGRGGAVYHVTTLSDSGEPGTLRYGLQSLDPSEPLTIVFDVGGWISLNENLGVTRDNVTIAGQTAPGGVGVRHRKFSIGGDHIIVRHVHFGYGRTSASANDTINVNKNSSDVIFDHIATVLGRDENFSAQSADLTLQWSVIAYGLQTHSAGSLLEQPKRLSFHHNLWAHNHTRNPKARVQEAFDYVNNVVYDYDIGFIAGDSDTRDYFWPNNFDGNYFITGPGDTRRDMIVHGRRWNSGLYFGVNYYDGDGDSQHDGARYADQSGGLEEIISGSYTRVDEPYPVADPIWRDATPEDAYQRVLAESGPTPQSRNELMEHIAANVADRRGGQISDQDELPVANDGWGALGGGEAPADADLDGMPEAWEIKHGTNPSAPNNNGDFDDDGYTDLEEYLNDIAAFKAAGPLEFDGDGRYADWRNWARRWAPSRVDQVRVGSGTAVVDAPGQKAGSLRVGAAAQSDGAVRVNDGWLEVTNNLEIGAGGAGRVEQRGGTVRVLNGAVRINNGAYRLRGGALHTPTLATGPRGRFRLEGGELNADVVAFDLENRGGVIAPGDTIRRTHVRGGLSLMSGKVRIVIASPDECSQLVIDGPAELGGILEVELANGFSPASGAWEIISAQELSGEFDSVSDGFSVRRRGDSVIVSVDAPSRPDDAERRGAASASQ